MVEIGSRCIPFRIKADITRDPGAFGVKSASFGGFSRVKSGAKQPPVRGQGMGLTGCIVVLTGELSVWRSVLLVVHPYLRMRDLLHIPSMRT